MFKMIILVTVSVNIVTAWLSFVYNIAIYFRYIRYVPRVPEERHKLGVLYRGRAGRYAPRRAGTPADGRVRRRYLRCATGGYGAPSQVQPVVLT